MTEDVLVAIWDHSLPRQWSLVSDQMLKPTPGDILDILARYAFPDRSISGVTSMLRDYTSVFWKLGRLYCSISSPPLKDFVTLTVDGTLFDELNLGMICTIIYHWLDCHILGLTLSHLQSKAMQFQTERESHVVDEVLITDPYSVGPRRVWDFYYNRVIPYYLLNKHMPDEWHNSTPGIQFVAISHSWVPSNDRISCYTPINHHAWPVPLPRGVDLENIRAEVKALYPEVRYCWLDVLCLRQEDTLAVPNQPSEAGIRGNRGNWLQALYLDKDYASGVIRGAELRIDVPTIGNIYLQAHGVIRYFNGLGRRFQGSNFNDPTHWLNRAWTLQEAVPNSVPGGVRDVIGNYKNAKGTRGGVTKRLREFLEEVEAAAGGKSVISLAHEMGTRHTMNAMDKIAGLSFILRFKQLPVYFGNEPIATAWDRCLSAMPAKYLEEIFINCPIIDQPRWVPSWDSLLTCCPSFIHNVDLYDKDRLRPKSPAPDRDPRAQGRAIYLEVCFTEVAYLDHVAELDYQASTRLGLQYNFFVSHEGDITIQGLGSYEEYYLATPRKRRVSPPAVEGHSLWIVLGGIAMTELGQQYRKSRKLGVLRTDEKIDQLQFRSGYIEAYLNSGNIYLFEGSAYSFL